jgi:phosphoesterase RecJ-like protein
MVMDDIRRFLEQYHLFIITTHIEPDGDAIGSELAMATQLKMMDRHAIMLNHDPVPQRYQFLTGWDCITTQKPISKTMDAAIFLDVGNVKRVGWVSEYIKELDVPTLNIDHHVSNTKYATVNYVDSNASSTCECLFDIFKALDLPLSSALCEYIATGIITDTGRFSFRNAGEKTFRTCADLVKCGTDFYELSQRIYANRSPASLQLLSMVLSTVRISDGVAFVNLTQQMLTDTGTKEEETEGFVNYVLALANIRAAVFFREKQTGETRVSLRAKNDSINVNTIAARFKGGGHKQAAGFRSRKSPEVLESEILEAFKHIPRHEKKHPPRPAN